MAGSLGRTFSDVAVSGLHVEKQLHSCDTFAGSVNGLSPFNYLVLN